VALGRISLIVAGRDVMPDPRADPGEPFGRSACAGNAAGRFHDVTRRIGDGLKVLLAGMQAP